jgi:hypothetical protein
VCSRDVEALAADCVVEPELEADAESLEEEVVRVVSQSSILIWNP